MMGGDVTVKANRVRVRSLQCACPAMRRHDRSAL